MATSDDFKCTNCGLSAEVSGGDDRGMIVKTRTVYCRTCQTLADVTIGFYDHPTLERASSDEENIGKCPICRGVELTKWSTGDPCPKCSGSVEKGGQTALWD